MAVNVFDRSVKALARRYPEPFVRVTLGSIEGLTVETIENPEINLPERRLDFVYGLRQEDREYILHLEFQLEHQADVPERMFTYNALLTAIYERPVLSAVIYLERRSYRRLPQEYADVSPVYSLRSLAPARSVSLAGRTKARASCSGGLTAEAPSLAPRPLRPSLASGPPPPSLSHKFGSPRCSSLSLGAKDRPQELGMRQRNTWWNSAAELSTPFPTWWSGSGITRKPFPKGS